MPTPPNSLAKARLTGADKQNPQRYRNRSEPNSSGQPVGDPHAYMTKTSKDVWRDLAGNLGWLECEDRLALEVASVAIGQIRDLVNANELVPSSLLSAANTAVGKLGATPTDRQKVMIPAKETEYNPFDQFMD